MSRLLGPVLLKPANELLFRFKNLSPSRLAKIQLCVAVSKDYMIIALDVTSWKTCPHPDVRSLTDNLLVELEVWFTKKDTYPELIPILIASIRSWLTDPYGEEPTFMWPTVLISEAILAQQQLGWYAFLMGCIAKPIVSLQNSYYITTHSKKKGTTWATKLIIKC